ncbi:MAG: hypothetical protein ACYCU0_12775 [Solirubrobacteraceae bacterium]
MRASRAQTPSIAHPLAEHPHDLDLDVGRQLERSTAQQLAHTHELAHERDTGISL